MGKTNELLAPVLIGLAVFVVALIILAFGEFYGEQWEPVAQGVTKFLIIITVFAEAVYALFVFLGRR